MRKTALPDAAASGVAAPDHLAGGQHGDEPLRARYETPRHRARRRRSGCQVESRTGGRRTRARFADQRTHDPNPGKAMVVITSLSKHWR